MPISEDPTRRTAHGLLERQARKIPDTPFLLFEEQVYSYAATDLEARRLAAGFQGYDIGPNDKVAIILRNRPEYLFLWFGLNKLGAVEVPLHTAHKGAVLKHMLDLSDSRFVVVEDQFLPNLLAVLPDLSKIDGVFVLGESGNLPPSPVPLRPYADLLEKGCEYDAADVRWSDPFAIIFTSGTTGPSKGALLPHNFAYDAGQLFVDRAGYVASDRFYVPLPFFHLHAMFASTIPAMLVGGSVVIVQKFSVSRLWDELRHYGCTTFNYTGGMIAMIANAEPRADDGDNPVRVMCGGGTPPYLREIFEERFGLTLIDEGYGMTEVGMPLMGSLAIRRSGTSGKLRDGYEVKIVDDEGQELGPNTPGELLVRPLRPYCMMLEYYNMPARTVEVWRDLWFHTGDYLENLGDGFYRFVDRKKDAFRRKGENISSFEVEAVVNQHPAVLQSAAVAAESDIGDDDVIICVACKPGQAVAPEDLIVHCEENMADFMVPRYVRFLDALPMTATARVRKHKLREEGVTVDSWDRCVASSRH
jgi:crotonobetaine/carnitine-CoA ligase